METRGSSNRRTSQTKNHPPEEITVSPSGAEELSQEHFSYLRLLFFLAISIFLAEVVAMILIYELPSLPYGYVTLIDAGTMTMLIFPLLYFLSFRPLVRHISKRRQAEEAVEAERKRFNNILEALPAYVVLLTPDYHVPFANRVFRERFGVSEGKSCYEHLFGRSEPCEICETYKVLKNMSPTRWEWTGPDSHIYDVFDFPFTDADGATMILEMGIDITEQKRAEDANRQLSRIVQQTEDTVVVTNRDGVIEYVNPAFERLTGFTNEEALGKTPRVIKSDLHDIQFYQTMWTTILKGDAFQGEIANRKKNGELFYEVKTITPLRDAQGNITHFVATGKDITKHKHDEAELLKAYDKLELRVQNRTEELKIANSALEKEVSAREQAQEMVRQREAMFRAVLEQMPSGVTVRDALTGQLIFSNVRSLEILHALAEIPDQFSVYRGFHSDGRPYPSDEWPVYRSMTTGEVINAEEIECERNDGTRFTIVVSSAPVYDGEGRIVNGVTVLDDITERKRAQVALQTANEELTRFNRAMIGRELRMIEMKKEVNELCESAGQPPRYSLKFEKE